MSDANGSPDLELVASDRLVDELSRRFDSSVFLGVKRMSDEQHYVARTFRTDDAHALLGLVEEFKCKLLRRLRRGQA